MLKLILNFLGLKKERDYFESYQAKLILICFFDCNTMLNMFNIWLEKWENGRFLHCVTHFLQFSNFELIKKMPTFPPILVYTGYWHRETSGPPRPYNLDSKGNILRQLKSLK